MPCLQHYILYPANMPCVASWLAVNYGKPKLINVSKTHQTKNKIIMKVYLCGPYVVDEIINYTL